MLALGVLGKPALLYSLFLLEYLEDAPQARTADDSENRAQHIVGHQKTGNDERDAGEKENPPASCSEIIFTLDDYRMEDTNDKKGDYCNDQP